ncbi:MAG: small ribosomal subunit biogenesis GTPase RsgA [Cyanobacteriota bacterium]|nr:small ribosomal subunit biogenesis GTPase RsgA [Cyanobacteriota bacterium]
MAPPRQYGVVTAIQANYYWVKVGDSPPLLCTRRSRLKKIGQTVVVGDQVGLDSEDGAPAIAEVLPRRSEFSRPPVANADQILLVFSLLEPSPEPWQVSRFLVKAESAALKVSICFSKRDLINETSLEHWQTRLENWGYESLAVSAVTGDGLDTLAEYLQDKITILAGPSGVGKSSLINALIPDGAQRVSQVSGKLQRGRHTTRHVELFALPRGGLLADTPGFNQPDLDAAPAELIAYFPEVKSQLAQGACFFNDCLHRGEPQCRLTADWERYPHYLKFLEEALERQSQKSRSLEATLKVKSGAEGELQYEPKLATKKYRRLSRRRGHQTLQSQYGEEEEEF